jgi:hypothetical protein
MLTFWEEISYVLNFIISEEPKLIVLLKCVLQLWDLVWIGEIAVEAWQGG